MTVTRDAKHSSLVEELLALFKQSSFDVIAVDGIEGYPPPHPLENPGYGDQQDKVPDVYAYDAENDLYIIGEAKTGEKDLESEHSLTQYNVFLDQTDARTGKYALLYVIIPSSMVPDFNTLITHYIHPDFWGNMVLVSSQRWKD